MSKNSPEMVHSKLLMLPENLRQHLNYQRVRNVHWQCWVKNEFQKISLFLMHSKSTYSQIRTD